MQTSKDFLVYPQIDSTSLEARRLLEQQDSPQEFTVFAHEQTAGRGRTGKSWQSDSGNLFLSLVVDISTLADARAALSLQVGAGVASWIKNSFRLASTIKWPNDLLVAGAKLAGILVELVAKPTKLYAIIGIGINLKTAPKSLDQATTCLSEILSDQEFDAKELSRQLSDFLFTYLVQGYWRSDFQEFSPSLTYPIAFQSKAYSYAGVGEDGSLILQAWNQIGSPLVLSNTDDSIRLYSQMSELPIACADLGNTSAKFYFFWQEENLVNRRHWRIDDKNIEAVEESLVELNNQLSLHASSKLFQPYPMFVSCVNRDYKELIASLAPNKGFKLIEIPSKSYMVDTHLYKGLGIDRRLLLEAAVALYPGENLIIVGCGTATTVDVVDRTRLYKGGWILPGLQLSLNALHTSTSKLMHIDSKDLDLNSQELGLGLDTKQALSHGVIFSHRAVFFSLKDKLERQSSQSWKIILTGGAARFFNNEPDIHVIEDLMATGLRISVLAGFKPST